MWVFFFGILLIIALPSILGSWIPFFGGFERFALLYIYYYYYIIIYFIFR